MERDAFHVAYLSDKIPEVVFHGQSVKTVAYLRVSAAQLDVHSQRLAILKYARTHDFRIDDCIEATASGQASEKRRVPDAAWPAVPLNRMNCVDHPPESTICGKNVSSVVDAAVSLAGGVVVIFISPLSLTRNLSPTMETSPVEVTRSTPEKLSGSANISSIKRAIWPEGGSASGPRQTDCNLSSFFRAR